jgi:hypothetical protein
MKRRRLIAVVIGLATAALVAATARATITIGEYWGDVDGDPFPESELAFDIKKTDSGKKKVKNVEASGLDFTCDKGSPGQTAGVSLDDSFVVKHKEFGGHTDSVTLGFDPHAKFEGELKGGGIAKGTISVHGKLDPLSQPDLKCKTGTLDWKVEKGAEPSPASR